MGNMEAGLMVSTSWMERTKSEMVGPWILWIGGVIDTSIILVVIMVSIMIASVIILIGGVTRDIY